MTDMKDGDELADDVVVEEDHPPEGRHVRMRHDLRDQQLTAALDPSDTAADASESFDALGVDLVELFGQAMEQTRMAIAVSDARADDQPLVYVNQAFENLTGYGRDEVVGHNCRFLQGDDTDPGTVGRIREGIAAREVFVVELKNYRKDGVAFWNTLHIGPIYDAAGRLTHFYGSQWDATELVEAREQHLLDQRIADELRHRTDNLFAVVNSIVHLSARGADSVDALVERIDGRIGALATAHRISIGGPEERGRDLHALVEAVLRPYRDLEGARIEVAGPTVALSVEAPTPLGITLHELATNAVKYGALGDRGGALRVAWEVDDDRLLLDWIETGESASDDSEGATAGTGSKLMRALVGAASGSVRTERDGSERRVRVEMPLA